MIEDENPAVTKAIDETIAENMMLKSRVKKLEEDLQEALKKLKAANDFIDNRNRSEVINEVKKYFNVDDIYIQEKPTEELKKMLTLSELVKPKVFKSSADISVITDELEKAQFKLRNRFKFGKE